MILAVIVAIAAFATFFVEIPKMYLNIGFIVLGIVIVILAIVFFTTTVNINVPGGGVLPSFKFSDKAGAGIWLALAGGVVIALAGILNIAGVFDKLLGTKNAQ